MGDNKEKKVQDAVASENRASNDAKFNFITETIKEKPVKKHTFRKILVSIFMGVLFGAAACAAFFIARPYMEKWFALPQQTKVVTLSVDEMETDETVDETAPVPESEEIAADEINNEEMAATPAESDEVEEYTEKEVVESSISAGKPGVVESSLEEKVVIGDSEEETVEEPVVTEVIKLVERDLEVADYKSLYGKLCETAGEASKALATVTGVYSDMDWFSNPYESSNQTTGLIIADNGKELLIIAQVKAIADADSIQVTFCDGATLPATVKKSDPNTELAIVAVELTDISMDTMDSIDMAHLGNSKAAGNVGSPVIAIGSPTGIQGSMTMGQITSTSYVKDQTDTNVHFLTTDIYGSINASGVLIDLDGKVLGIIYQDMTVTDSRNLIKAYGISDLKTKIEKISNGQDFAYLGIIGTDVTEEANEELGVPMGAYIKEVVLDSPAMEEGLRSGDVIVKMGTAEVKSFDNFKDIMLKCQPGDLMMITVKRLGVDEYVDVSYEVTLGTLTEKK